MHFNRNKNHLNDEEISQCAIKKISIFNFLNNEEENAIVV